MNENPTKPIDCYNLREIHGARNAALEKAVVDSPDFRDKNLRLLCGVSPLEVTRSGDPFPPIRMMTEWDRPLFPYLLCQGDQVLMLLTAEEEETTVDLRRAEPPPSLMKVQYRQGQEEAAGSMTARLQALPPQSSPFRCILSPLPLHLIPDLIRLGLILKEDPLSQSPPLPTVFGSECGLVRAYWTENGSLCHGTLCADRSLPFLEWLIAVWPSDPPASPTVIPLLDRLKWIKRGFSSNPAYGKRQIEQLCSTTVSLRLMGEKPLENNGPDSKAPPAEGDTFLEAAEKLYQAIQKSRKGCFGDRLTALAAPLIPSNRR